MNTIDSNSQKISPNAQFGYNTEYLQTDYLNPVKSKDNDKLFPDLNSDKKKTDYLNLSSKNDNKFKIFSKKTEDLTYNPFVKKDENKVSDIFNKKEEDKNLLDTKKKEDDKKNKALDEFYNNINKNLLETQKTTNTKEIRAYQLINNLPLMEQVQNLDQYV